VSLIKGRRERGVSENRVLGSVLGPKRCDVPGDWRTFHNEMFHDLYSSPYIIRLFISRRTRWAGHVARMVGQKRCVQNFGRDR